MDNKDDRGNDDDGDTTGGFKPGSASTPGPSEQITLQMRKTMMNRPPERGSKTAETSFTESVTESQRTLDYDSMKIKSVSA